MNETMRSATPEGAELLVELLAESNTGGEIDGAAWHAIVREAVQQDVLPLLHARIRSLPGGTVPAATAAGVRARYVKHALQSALIFRELDLIAGTLAKQGIPVMLLKGLHLAADLYAEPGMRTMGDLDVMVPRDRLGDAATALADAGFVGEHVDDLDDFCRTNSHLPRMAPPNGLGVGLEVHWTIELPSSPFDIRPAELWANARPLTVNRRELLVLSPEHLLLHLCLHACHHHKLSHTPLKQLCDVAIVLTRYEQRIDWDVLIGTAERWRIQPFVRFMLMLTSKLLGSTVPDAVQSLPADAEEARLIENARAYILNRTMTMPTALTQVVRARNLTRRLRALGRHVFPRPVRMASIYGLPTRSARVYLWYFLRPFDLIMRKGKLTLELLLPGRSGRRMRYTERNRALLKTSLREWAQAAASSDE